VSLRSSILPFCAVLAACGAPAHVGPVRDLPERARALLASAPPVYAPEAAGAPPSADAQTLRGAFEGALSPEVRGQMRHDPALDLAATMFAETYSETERTPAHALSQWMVYESGSVALAPWFEVSFGGRARRHDLDDIAVESARKLEPSILPRAFGVARFTEGKLTSQAIVVATAPLDVQPFQKSYAPGAPLTLAVRPRDASTGFVFYADGDDGSVVEEPMAPRPDGTLFVSHAVPARPGRYFVEVRATEPVDKAPDPWNPTAHPLLLVPIYVGMPEPREPEDFIKNPAGAPADPAAWPAWIRAMYDAQRARWHKPPMLEDPRLTALAEARAAAVAPAHGEPAPERGLSRKMRAAGIPVRTYHWETSHFDAVADYVYMRLLSPARRKTIVHSDEPTFAVGIAPRPPDARGRVTYAVVEYTVFTGETGGQR
jgi:hypothetical protein